MTKRTKIVSWILGGLLLAIVAIIIAVYSLISSIFLMDSKPSWTSLLPPTATEVQESSWADGFLPDCSYQLKARITEAEFQKFVTDLRLTPHTPDRQYSEDSWLSWGSSPQFQDVWWDPSEDLSSTFVSEGHDTWTYAKFEKGHLHLKSLIH